MSVHFLPPKLSTLVRTCTIESDLLDRLLGAMWDGTTHEDIRQDLASGELEAYTTGEALVLIQTMDWPAGRELLIYGTAGRGILKQVDAIVADLKVLAKHKGCSMIGAMGNPIGWSRIGPRLGFKPVATHYVMELEDGR
jgi:hypothetical protein